MALRKRSTAERGYGHQHRLYRENLRPLVESGRAVCNRCGLPVDPLRDEWHVDHADDRRGYQRNPIAHASCNMSAGGRKGAARTNATRVAARAPAGATAWSRCWDGGTADAPCGRGICAACRGQVSA